MRPYLSRPNTLTTPIMTTSRTLRTHAPHAPHARPARTPRTHAPHAPSPRPTLCLAPPRAPPHPCRLAEDAVKMAIKDYQAKQEAREAVTAAATAGSN